MTQYLDITSFATRIHSLKKFHKQNHSNLSALFREDYATAKRECDQLQTILLEIEKECMSLYGKQGAICEHLHSQLAAIQEEPTHAFQDLKRDCLRVRNEAVVQVEQAIERFRQESATPVSGEVKMLLSRLKRVITQSGQ
mmetsp:Transcript_5304/g.19833  ORF Transcript_5304/g.19833 Transcript_5304/m.19833 type:complete len:140 (-) Transcript_5304:127-546(-)